MEKKEFREEFSQFMKQTGKSQKQVSKETGLSTSVISQFLDGKYTGDNGKVQDILNKFLSISRHIVNLLFKFCYDIMDFLSVATMV